MNKLRLLLDLIEDVFPMFLTSLISAGLTFLFKLRKITEKNEVRDAVLESLFCIPFGTLLGFLALKMGTSDGWQFISASAGGMFGTKLYHRFSEKIETVDFQDLTEMDDDPLSILTTQSNETQKPMNNKAYFFGFGLNSIDTSAYAGDGGQLKCSENDIDKLESLFAKKGFRTFKKLKTKEATRSAVRSTMNDLANTLKKGDTLAIAYSGHGGQAQNATGGKLETFCLYDGQFADFEMLNLIAALPKGVKVINVYDCCHSGGFDEKSLMQGKKVKTLPMNLLLSLDNGDVAKSIKANIPLEMKGGQKIKFMFACQKNEVAYDGQEGQNSLFTQSLLQAHEANETSDYTDFQNNIQERCKLFQRPRFLNRPLSNKDNVEHFSTN